MTVGEKLLFFEGEESRLAMQYCGAFLCDIDNKPISFHRAKLILNALSDKRPERGILVWPIRSLGLAVPRTPAHHNAS